MMPSSIIRDHSPTRLRTILGILFVVLALPTAAVIWQAYDQLKWEGWFQYRSQAELLTSNIDSSIANRIRVAESRSFADFEFVSATGNASVVQRSPLSAFPVPQDVPGVVGFFQIDPNGRFSTPLVPDTGTQAENYGISDEELEDRILAREQLRQVLLDNALVREPVIATGGRMREALPSTADETDRLSAPTVAEPSASPAASESFISSEISGVGADLIGTASEDATPASQTLYEQDRFDQLNQPGRAIAVDNAAPQAAALMPEDEEERRQASLGKVEDLRLNEVLQKRSESLDRDFIEEVANEPEKPQPVPSERARRVEQTATYSMQDVAEPGAAGKEERITTFQSEIDPYEFSLLDSGHMVLYRNAWRDNDRYIQGLLIDQAQFSRDVVETAFQASGLADMSNLIVGYRDDIINVVRGGSYETLLASPSELAGELLYRARLSAPLDGIELIFAINEMPPGPGATVLGWTTMIIGIVFVGSFYAMYRLGMGQIQLARQQQDFVSAVSHELKTPLTSIRMYGEMLKEGWADEDKKKQYYDYIHDESERLTRLISNVLQLARITRNEPQFDLRPVSIATLVDQVRSKIASHVERAGFELALKIDDKAKSSA
ncbi:MAG: histidine kinase, partial [Gammaproteobacteria bacterium]|nr:histidine kinase [Gammaproteobacteria bacterium]